MILPAAVTIVPVAAAVVVFVVTTAIAMELGHTTFVCLRTLALLLRGVSATTFRTITELVLITASPATVTAVPVATMIVIPIVTTFVAFPLWFFTGISAALFL